MADLSRIGLSWVVWSRGLDQEWMENWGSAWGVDCTSSWTDGDWERAGEGSSKDQPLQPLCQSDCSGPESSQIEEAVNWRMRYKSICRPTRSYNSRNSILVTSYKTISCIPAFSMMGYRLWQVPDLPSLHPVLVRSFG